MIEDVVYRRVASTHNTSMSTKKRKVTKQRVYWPNCSVCKFMQKNKQFRYDCMESLYFNPEGKETLTSVNFRYGSPFQMSLLYQHFKRHQWKDMVAAEQRLADSNVALPPARKLTSRTKEPPVHHAEELAALEAALPAVEGDVISTQPHERALDEFIRQAALKVRHGEIQINASSFLSAIKIKAEIEKNTKDRRLDAIKMLFKGAAPVDAVSEESTLAEPEPLGE